MSERLIRRDPLSGTWVIFAPERGRRPGATVRRQLRIPEASGDGCPFCPGQESRIPPVLHETSGTESGLPWMTRAFENKHPAVAPEIVAEAGASGLYTAIPARGRQEVIVESSKHERDFADMSRRELEAVVETYVARLRAARDEHPDLYPVLFKNHGAMAGASLRHPHAQLIAVPVVPPDVRSRERRVRAFHRRRGKCLVCSIQRRESRQRERVVLRDGDFVSFVPFAAAVPYEVMIVPRVHQADITLLSPRQTQSLAHHIQVLTRSLRDKVADPDYNLLVTTPSGRHMEHPGAHWYLAIRPRYGTEAGFERATGMRINASWPEEDARVLRNGR